MATRTFMFLFCSVVLYDAVTAQCSDKPLIIDQVPEAISPPDEDGDGYYDRREKCEWIITVSDGSRVELIFDADFNITDTNRDHCDFSHIQVFDGNSTEHDLRGRFCGEDAPSGIISSSNSLLLQFTSGNTETGTGFTAYVKEISVSSLEFIIVREEKTWDEARAACRNMSGFLASPTSSNKTFQQQLRPNESVWSGAYATPWMWARECYAYDIEGNEKKYDFISNSVAKCQERCGTEQIWIQGSNCLCNISFYGSAKVGYDKCNETCPRDQKDVCGGAAGYVMHYQTISKHQLEQLSLDNTVNGHCVYIDPLRLGDKQWRVGSCFGLHGSHLPLCKGAESEHMYKYFIPWRETSRFWDNVIYSQAVELCLGNKSMIADISDEIRMSSVQSYLNDVQGTQRNPTFWIGLKRSKHHIKKHRQLMATPSFCYAIRRNKNGNLKELQPCELKKSFVCKIPTNKKTTVNVHTGSSPVVTTGSTTTTESTQHLSTSTNNVNKEDNTAKAGGNQNDHTVTEETTTKTEENKYNLTVLVSLVVVAVLFLVTVVVVVAVCLRRRSSGKRMKVSVRKSNHNYDYAETGNFVELGNTGLDRKQIKYSSTKIDTISSGKAKENHEENVANNAIASTDGNTYNELGAIKGSGKEVNLYSLNNPDDGTYHHLTGTKPPQPEVDLYSVNQPDDGTYNVLQIGNHKTRNDVEDLYDHTKSEEIYNELGNGGKEKVLDVEGVYDRAHLKESDYNELSIGNRSVDNAVVDDTYDHN